MIQGDGRAASRKSPGVAMQRIGSNVLEAICYRNTEPMRLTCAITDSECDEVSRILMA
jgi:hypothetical protein